MIMKVQHGMVLLMSPLTITLYSPILVQFWHFDWKEQHNLKGFFNVFFSGQ